MLKILFSLITLLLAVPLLSQSDRPPNVVVIITDDQGYGDLGYHGNSLIRTPAIDSLASQSVRFSNFYVSPVCAPTRASLMTGRYSLRTGVRDTNNGGAIMASSEVTLAELLLKKGYRTGIFGKWHLGDNYPARPSDQGFEESLVHLGGGMGQPGDFTTYFQGDSSYFDPILWYNNKPTPFKGYCSDIFASAANDFVQQDDERPFFCYLAFNAPHTPLQVKQSDYLPYANAPVAEYHLQHGGDRHPMTEDDVEDARLVYGMVSNIDNNVGQLLHTLDSLGITDNTIVIFMSDNGPEQYRYKGGLRGVKTEVYEGGIRSPFFLKYPADELTDTTIRDLAAHIDVLPTIAELCGLQLPTDREIDGKSQVSLMKGQQHSKTERSFFFHWSRRYPVPFQNMSLIKDSYKMVGFTDYDAQPSDFILYNLEEDPDERVNLIDDEPLIGQQLFTVMKDHYHELVAEPHIQQVIPITIDTTKENPIYLNRNDVSGQRAIWRQEEAYGKWVLNVETPGTFSVTYQFIQPVPKGGTLFLELGSQIYTTSDQKGGSVLQIDGVVLRPGPVDLIPFYEVDGRRILPLWVRLQH